MANVALELQRAPSDSEILRTRPRISESDWHAFLSKPKVLLWLIRLARKQTQIVDRVEQYVRMVDDDQDVCYLFDCDMLVDFVRGTHDSVSASYLVLLSDVPYAIPSGAADEFLNFIGTYSQTHKRITSISWAGDRLAVLRQLAEALGVTQTASSEQDLLAEVSDHLTMSSSQLTRICSVLGNPRLMTVVSPQNPERVKKWKKLVESAPRPDDERRRSTKDLRDAKNLAVAVSAPDEGPFGADRVWHGGFPRFMLISTTRDAVTKLPETIVKSGKQIDDLAELLGIDRLEVGLAAEEFYPVLTPIEAVRVEQLGGWKRPRLSQTMVGVFRHCFSQIADEANQMLNYQNRRKNLSKKQEAHTGLHRRYRENIRHSLETLDKEFKQRPALLRLAELEATNRLSESTSKPRAELLGPNGLKERTDDFLRLLEELSTQAGSLISYSLSVTRSPLTAPFMRIRVTQSPGTLWSPAIWGEIYDGDRSKGFKPTHFVLRWVTVSDELAFLTGLSQILHTVACPQSLISSSASSAVANARMNTNWEHGVLIVTNQGELHLPLSQVADKGHWTHLSMSELKRFATRKWPEVKEEQIEIDVIRINTPVGSFVYESRPPIGELDKRTVSVVSHVDLSYQIARLFEYTSPAFCAPGALTDVLHDQLSRFFRAPKSHVFEVN